MTDDETKNLIENLKMVLTTGVEALLDASARHARLVAAHLEHALAYGNAQRERGDRLQEALDQKHLEIANMMRENEEVQLAHARLQLDLERLRMEHDARRLEQRARLDAIARAFSPFDEWLRKKLDARRRRAADASADKHDAA